jgi:hypothetical protein
VTPAINYHLCSRYRRIIITGVIVIGDKLIGGCFENPEQGLKGLSHEMDLAYEDMHSQF